MAPPRVLLVTGSRALAERPEAEAWARAQIAARVAALPPGSLVLAGGAAGPDTWAREAGRRAGVKVAELRLDGHVWVDERRLARTWYDPATVTRDDARRWPLARNAALVEAATRARADGWDAEVLALKAPWSATDGTGHAHRLAAGAGIAGPLLAYNDAEAAVAAQVAALGDEHRDLVWVDTETSGRLHAVHQLIEVACLRTDPGMRVVRAAFETKVFLPPGAPRETEALAINGYTEAAWAGAPGLREAVGMLAAWLPPVFTLAGYSVAFDRRFLEAAFVRCGRAAPGWRAQPLDVLYKARQVLGKRGLVPNCQLTTVCDHYGISNEGAHGAMSDIRRTLAVARRLMGYDAALDAAGAEEAGR